MSCGCRRNKWNFTLTKYQVYCKKLSLEDWIYMQLSSYHPVQKLNEHLGIYMVIKHQYQISSAFPDRVNS